MAKDWEKIAGEKGEEVDSNRVSRAWKLGSMGASVASTALGGKLRSLFSSAEDQEETLRASHRHSARKMAEVLGSMKGASMKLGQILSADPELLPDEFTEGLSVLQKSAPPMTWNTVRTQIEAALDRPLDVVFREFDPEPIGSASIGQVHKAVLHDGQVVAIKVQYPGVADSVESDLKTLKQMMSMGRPFMKKERLDRYFTEIRQSLILESDYVREAQFMQQFHDIFQEKEGFRAPKPVMEWTRSEVLVMEYVEGRKIDEALLELPAERRAPYLLRFVELYSWMFHELNLLHADPHPGNFLLTEDGEMIVLDFGCVRAYDPELPDAALEVLDTVWENDPERALRIYQEQGWGSSNSDLTAIKPEVLQSYHDIILAPFARDEPFDFANWQPAFDGKAYMLRNPSLLQLSPPPALILYLRVLSGIKGLMARMEAKINVYQPAWETARRRGLLTNP